MQYCTVLLYLLLDYNMPYYLVRAPAWLFAPAEAEVGCSIATSPQLFWYLAGFSVHAASLPRRAGELSA